MRHSRRPRAVLRVEQLEDRSAPAIVHPLRSPSDPGVTDHWALARIAAPAAWDVQTGTRHTVVAVIDSGIDATHPDLAANLWVNPREAAGDGIDNDGNGFTDDVHGANFAANTGDPQDVDGHGTHIAGVIGAVGDNGVGVAGVLWNTRIMALKFLVPGLGGYTTDAARALDYAVANGAKVVNISWGGPDADDSLAAAIGQARDAGVIVVAAAGNDGRDTDAAPFYPAGYVTQFDNVVTVAASDRGDRLAGFSNFGPATVTLAAPGASVNSTLPNNRYAPLGGTSVATPFVAGAVALLWDEHPDWTYRQVIEKLTQSVDQLPALAGRTITGGRLNLARLLDAPTPPPVVPPTVPPPTGDGLRVTHSYFAGAAAGTFDRARVTFGTPIEPATFTPDDVAVIGPDGLAAVTGIAVVPGTDDMRFDVSFAPQSQAGVYTITVGPDVRDTAGIPMDQDRDDQAGEGTDDRFSATATLAGTSPTPPPAVPPTSPPAVPPAPIPAGRFTFPADGLPVTIPDRGTATVTINLDRDVTITDLNIRLTVAHTYVGDLVIQLAAPDGQTVTLANRRGGSGDDFADTAFDDAAGARLSSGRAPFRGAFRPEQSLAMYAGVNARGTWILTVSDLAAKDVGHVTEVTLSIAGTAVGQAVTGQSVAFWDDGRPEVVAAPAAVSQIRPETRAIFGLEGPTMRSQKSTTSVESEPGGRAESSRPTNCAMVGLEDSAHPTERPSD